MKQTLQHLNGLAIIALVTILFGVKLGAFLLIAQFAIAATLGYFFDILDRVVQYLIGDSVDERKGLNTQEIAEHARKMNWTQIHRISPLTQSFWFLVAYFPLTIFVFSSTGSLVGMAFMMGLGIRYTTILVQDLSEQRISKSVFFDDASIKFTTSELKKISWGYLGIFVFLVLLAWIRL